MALIRTIQKHYLLALYCSILIAINAYAYFGVKYLYFLNDEWVFIGGVHVDGYLSLLRDIPWYRLLAGVGRPLGTTIQNLFFIRYPYNPAPFVIFGIVMHTVNGILVFILARKISKSMLTAFVSGLFFATASVYLQTIDWISCLVEIPGSTVFALLSIYLILSYAEYKNRITLLISFFLSYISFLLLDANAFLFILNPLVLFLYQRKQRTYSWIYYVGNVATLLLSTYARFGLRRGTFSNTFIISPSIHSFTQPLFNSIYYPVIGIAQTLIPTRLLLRISRWFMDFEYNHIVRLINEPQLLATSVIPDILLVGISLTVIFISYLLFSSRRSGKKPILAAVMLYVLGFTPIAFFLTWRNTSFIESRYMYVPTIGIALLFGFFVQYVTVYLTRKFHRYALFVMASILIVCIGYFYKQVSVVRGDLRADTYAQQEIKNLVDQFLLYAHSVPDKPIFYVTSDVDFYFHFNNKIPFQEGTGYMLMVLYHDTGVVPDDFIRNQYLIRFGEQGYQEEGSKAFGYYWDKSALAELFKRNSDLKPEQVVAFIYQSSTHKLIPITEEIRSFIKK